MPQELAADLAEITFEYPFQIPPYFALVIRAIGVLEGECVHTRGIFPLAFPILPSTTTTTTTSPLSATSAGDDAAVHSRR